jgi:hypothetical protein
MVFLTHLYRLQGINQFAIKSSPADAIGFIVTFAILTALIVFMNVSKRIKDSAAFKGKGVKIKTGTGLKVDSTFYGKIKYLNLSKKEAAVLQKILGSDGGDPAGNLLNSAKVDENFGLVYRRIVREKTAEDAQDAQADLLELFSIRNAVELFLASEKNTTGKNVVRNFRRINTNIDCKIYLVIMNNESSKAKKKLVIQHDSVCPGIIQNISQGGCSMIGPSVLKINSLVKIDFNIDGHTVAALGQIMRINKEANKFIYHIKFLKLSRQAVIDLNTFVFGYH